MPKQVAYASTATGANVPAPATNGHRRADSKRKVIHLLQVAGGCDSVPVVSRHPSLAFDESSDKDGERAAHGHKEGSTP